jgi:two-component system, chemotaxis family, CheB/CheR fusion protein
MHNAECRTTMSSTHLNPNGLSKKCANCPALLDGTELQLKLIVLRETAVNILSNLTTRQQQIMRLVIDGHPSKNIATDLGISQRTVENHRAAIMKKTGSHSLPALARVALAAEVGR